MASEKLKELQEKISDYKSDDLFLTDMGLTDSHMPIIIEQAINEKKVSSLYIDNNAFTAAGVKLLVDDLIKTNNTALEKLFLQENMMVGDEGAVALAELLKQNRTLKSISLSETGIGDRGIQALCKSLESNTVVECLYLSVNIAITDMSLDAIIHMLQQNKILQHLEMFMCSSLSSEGKAQLRYAANNKENFNLFIS